MKTKKSLGQNFLRDKGVLKKIADFAQIDKGSVVVEVGPGEGTLTEFLLERAKKVIAVEKDERMVEFLKEKFVKEIREKKLEVVEDDILSKNIFSPQAPKCTDVFLLENSSCSPQSSSQGIFGLVASKYFLVGNIPYYITGALFKVALEAENPPESITFVVQKEVAERITARDGKESVLSISIKAYGTPELGGIIRAGSFYPKPKIDSAIISIRGVSKKRFLEAGVEEEHFFKVLKAGFAHKRKKLLSNLKMVLGDSTKLKEVFKKCNLSEKVRAENLKISDWICLTKNLLPSSEFWH